MPTSRSTVAVFTVFGLLSSACSSHKAAGGDPAADAPKPVADKPAADKPVASSSTPTTLPAGKPATPVQFTSVAEADWDMSKPIVGTELKCENNKIRVFDCEAVTLLAYLPNDSIGGGQASDIWGWTDTTTGREFALVGRNMGTSFVEITDPVNPRYLGDLPRHEGANAAIWRDIKVYKNHAFIVSEGRRHGMQVFDLTQLRKVSSPPVTFQETTHYAEVNSVHNIVLNEETGFAYAVGSGGGGQTCGGGLHMIDIRTPTAPKFAGCYAETLAGKRTRGYIHDAQCVTYKGPDQQYKGREICFNSAEKALGIVDVTDKQQPKGITVAEYPNAGYTHQGWLSEDQHYFFLGDEGDERMQAPGVGEHRWRTLVFDVSDLDQPVLLPEFWGTVNAGDHNLYVRGRYAYQSNYKAGLRIVDVGDPKALKEVGYLHSPKANSWSNYPLFGKQKDVVVFTNMPEGLFIVRHVPGT